MHDRYDVHAKMLLINGHRPMAAASAVAEVRARLGREADADDDAERREKL